VRRNVLFVLLGLVTAVVLLAGTALATNATFILGSTTANKPDALTAVTAQNKDGHGGLNGPMIQLTNQSTASNASALGLEVDSGRPPLKTNSATRVPNLNADLLDGVDSSALLQGGGQLQTVRLVVPPSGAKTFGHPDLPAFTIYVGCPADPSTNGAIQFTNRRTASADMFVERADGSTSEATGPSGFGVNDVDDPSGNMVTFDASWPDGHGATVWVTSYHRWNEADASKNGCYAYVMAVVR
jgi:hypothetical protein